MRKEVKQTFISEVHYDTKVVGGKRVVSPHFFILTPGSDPLKLEYGTVKDADQSRSELLENEHAHAVENVELFWAISEAFKALVEPSLASAR